MRIHTHLADHAVDGIVLVIVLAQRENANQHGKNFSNRNAVPVLQDHTAQAACRIVGQTGLLDVQASIQLLEDDGEGGEDLLVGRRFLNETSDGVARIATCLEVLVSETTVEKLQEAAGERGDGIAHASDDLGKDTNGSGSLERLAAGGILEDNLFELGPEVHEVGAKSHGKTRNDIEGGVNDKPVELGVLIQSCHLLVFHAEILLRRVLLVDDGVNKGDDLFEGALVGDEVRAAELEVLSDIAVDLSHGAPSKPEG